MLLVGVVEHLTGSKAQRSDDFPIDIQDARTEIYCCDPAVHYVCPPYLNNKE
jgi:hypothetical protein